MGAIAITIGVVTRRVITAVDIITATINQRVNG
jgi:hypothetical protein